LALASGVTLLGNPEDPSAAVIDGRLQGRILTASGGTEIRGMTFRDGNAGNGHDGAGGGVEFATGRVADCIFEGCVAKAGGGLYAASGSIERCTFRSCRAVLNDEGAGALGGGAILYQAQMRDCVFEGNESRAAGGGLYSTMGVVVSCVFRGNTAAWSAGGAAGGSFDSCQFVENTAGELGGGLDAAVGTVQSCVFRGNHARLGGAVCSPHRVTNCVFLENVADAAGGAVYGGLPVVSGCVFYANTAAQGGGLFAESVDVSVDQCTFVANTAPYGGSSLALVPAVTNMRISRSILAYSPLGIPVLYWTAPGVPPLIVRCTDVSGNAEGDWVGGLAGSAGRYNNFSADPRFCDWVGEDFTLSDASPCLPEHSACGEQVGALGEGCGAVAVEPWSWGRLKAAFR